MPIGKYRIECEANGFKRSLRTDMELTVNHTVRIDLQIGSIEQSVGVATHHTQVNTANTEFGQLVDTKRGRSQYAQFLSVHRLAAAIQPIRRLVRRTGCEK
jgi:hypothetical protein